MALKEAEPSDYPNELRVIEYNPNADALTESLGLLDNKRLEKQMKAAVDAWNDSETFSKACVKISRLAENANELAFLFLNLGIMAEESRRGGKESKNNQKEKV